MTPNTPAGGNDALPLVETLGPTGRSRLPLPTQAGTQLAVRSTPAALGYRMPAEWEPHAATWLAWPHNTITWPDQLAQVQDIFLCIIAALQGVYFGLVSFVNRKGIYFTGFDCFYQLL